MYVKEQSQRQIKKKNLVILCEKSDDQHSSGKSFLAFRSRGGGEGAQ